MAESPDASAGTKVLLFTQCLQNDFVRPLAPGERLPNALHVGRDEARRIVGEEAQDGPLERFLRAFFAGAGERHASFHVRDWHDPADPRQRAHLEHYGPHCIRETEGARFIAAVERGLEGAPRARVIDSPGLTDFEGTSLAADVRAFLGDTPPERVKAAIIGAWTDVKVHYLAYDLATRLGLTQIAVPGPLTASRSRARHRAALDHLREVLGVLVMDSIPGLLAWLEVDPGRAVPPSPRGRTGPEVRSRDGEAALEGEERDLVAWLFRDAREVTLARLGGGFSGSRVYRTKSVDLMGRAQVPYVVKVDTHEKIAKERVAVESVEQILGPAAPVISEYTDGPALGAIQYGFATMLGSETRTLLSRLRAASGPAEVDRLFDGVDRVLERLHQAPVRERLQLFRWFTFKPEYAANTLERARGIAGADDPDVRALSRFTAALPALLAEDPQDLDVAMIHGDLNLANLLQDDAGNTWLIDYFWTRQGPVLQDAAKLENDLRYIAFGAGDARGLREAAVARVRARLERTIGGPVPARAYAIARYRYAAHSLSFDECDAAQKRLALADAARLAAEILGETP